MKPGATRRAARRAARLTHAKTNNTNNMNNATLTPLGDGLLSLITITSLVCSLPVQKNVRAAQRDFEQRGSPLTRATRRPQRPCMPR
ncbi:hypothetical protein E2C01_050840 [Portunus trituberculatus]|uniref:Uncharacterized protein n=1 Tax=Portunus trituberculatus TaxID=210409 RepID=A0A5B7GK16_PORTR|nr:hypothetical protein [Portunus trituberculatus]